MELEKRYNETTFKEGVVSGYVCLWGEKSYVPQIGKYETFTKGSLKLRDDGCPMYLQHKKAFPLGNSASGTLKLKEDSKGLFYECKIPESDHKTRELLERGDLKGASVSFYPSKTSYKEGVRHIESALIDEISLVCRPAHKGVMNYREKGTPKKRRQWSKVLWVYP